MPDIPWAPRGLYLLTPDETDTTRLLERVDTVLAEAALLQYRNKQAGADLQRIQAAALLRRCRAAGVPLVINDDPVLAAATGADGVHLGEQDPDIGHARALLGTSAIIGVSCYNDAARARAMARAGADYLAFGAFFPSSTKPAARKAEPGLLRECSELGLPQVAIGGITADNGRTLVDAGADLLAVISDVFDSADPQQAARAYRGLFA